LHSSKSIKSKILQAAIEVDQDYRRYREAREIKRIDPYSYIQPAN
jgi:UDP-N-acetyl-D-mannosaminuronic acid dehydrogenase